VDAGHMNPGARSWGGGFASGGGVAGPPPPNCRHHEALSIAWPWGRRRISLFQVGTIFGQFRCFDRAGGLATSRWLKRPGAYEAGLQGPGRTLVSALSDLLKKHA